jgi:hypothetical protein
VTVWTVQSTSIDAGSTICGVKSKPRYFIRILFQILATVIDKVALFSRIQQMIFHMTNRGFLVIVYEAIEIRFVLISRRQTFVDPLILKHVLSIQEKYTNGLYRAFEKSWNP